MKTMHDISCNRIALFGGIGTLQLFPALIPIRQVGRVRMGVRGSRSKCVLPVDVELNIAGWWSCS